MLLFIHPHLTYPGGGTKFILEIGRDLVKSGFNVGILSIRATPEIKQSYPEIKFFDFGGPLSSKMAHWLTYPLVQYRVSRYISRLKPKVIFPQSFPSNLWALSYKMFHKQLPCVWYCHEPSAFIHDVNRIRELKVPIKYAAIISNPIFQLLDRMLAGNADIILTNSHFSVSQIKKIYHRDAEVLYPVFLDKNKFKFQPQKEDYFFTFGQLTRFKRFDLAIRAMSIVKTKSGKAITLKIGGEGSEKDNLIRLVNELGLQDIVKFIGIIPENELATLLGKAKIVVYTSINEPFGLIPLEAMCCGTPVIANDSGGPKETVVDGETGFLFRSGDHNDLAEKILLILNNPQLAERLSFSARKHIENNFDRTNTVRRLYEIFSPYLLK